MLQSRGLIDFKGIDREKVLKLFDLAKKLKVNFSLGEKSKFPPPTKSAALIFFESSTRTRLSFEMACLRSGFYPLRLDSKESSSLSKGETPLDTVENIAAMDPDVIIVRGGSDLNFNLMSERIKQPIINAGWGTSGHPTQGLLDAFTLFEKNPQIEKEKVVIIGDIDHSRVASSHRELAQILGYELKFCGPDSLTTSVPAQARVSLKDAIDSATALMFLRVQKERHDDEAIKTNDDYISKFGFDKAKWNLLKPNQRILHPGPVNYGVEIDEETARHPQSLILEQVRNGVVIRQAILEQLKDYLK